MHLVWELTCHDRLRSGRLYLWRCVELLEVLGEARRKIGGHLVVGCLVLPGIAGIQQFRRNSGTDLGILNPNAGSISNSTLASLPSTSALTMARVYGRLMRLPTP